MALFSFLRKKPSETPEEELRRIEFKLREYSVPDREKLERRRDELLSLIAKAKERESGPRP